MDKPLFDVFCDSFIFDAKRDDVGAEWRLGRWTANPRSVGRSWYVLSYELEGWTDR